MNIEVETTNLKTLCRLCLSDEGEVHITEDQVKLHASREDVRQPEESGESNAENLLVCEMLKMFQGFEEALLVLRADDNLICGACLKDVVTAYLLHKRILTTCQQLRECYEEGGQLHDQDEPEMQLELIEEKGTSVEYNENEDCSFREEGENTNYDHASEDDPAYNVNYIIEKIEENVMPDIEAVECIEEVETVEPDEPTLNRSDEEQAEEIPNNASSKRNSAEAFEHADSSFVITKFFPIDLEETDPLAEPGSKRLRTLDFAAIEVKGEEVNEVGEGCLFIASQERAANNSDFSSTREDKGGGSASGGSIYVCKYCPEAFSTMSFLLTHSRRAHICKYCTMGFVKTADLHSHVREQHSQHTCAICQKTVKTHGNLRAHLKKCHGISLPTESMLLDYRPAQASKENVANDFG